MTWLFSVRRHERRLLYMLRTYHLSSRCQYILLLLESQSYNPRTIYKREHMTLKVSIDGPRHIMANSVLLGMETFACSGILVVWCMLARRDKPKPGMEGEGSEGNGFSGEDEGLGFRHAL